MADRAGVSRSTVSQILNGRGELFAEETRERVRRAVEELGYLPSTAGRTLARGSSDIVISLIPNTTFGGNLQESYEVLTDELAKRGLTLLLRFSQDSPQNLERLAVGLKPRAILTVTPLPPDLRAAIVERGVEVLEPNPPAGTDVNSQIGKLQARHLVGHGYRRLAYAHLKDARMDPFGASREQGFVDECRELGLERPTVVHLGIDPKSASAALADLGMRGVGVGCYNDDVATALLHTAHVAGWRCPEDIALIGMDDTALAAFTSPPLTTIGYDAAQLIRGSLEGLLRRLDHVADTEPAPEVVLQVIERESV